MLTRSPLFSRARAGVAVVAIGVLAFFGWGSEVPSLSRAKLLFAVGALAVLAPVGLLVLNLLLSLRTAARTDRGLRRRLGSGLGLHVVGLRGPARGGIGRSAGFGPRRHRRLAHQLLVDRHP